MAEKREWWPEDFVDEAMPEGRDSPDAWLAGAVQRPDGWLIRSGEEDEGVGVRVALGEVLDFVWCERHGEVEVTFKEGGGWTAHGPVPDGYNWCRIAGDQDTLQGSLDELAAEAAAGDYLGRQAVQFATWSESVPHRLVGSVGRLLFIPLEYGHG